MLVEGIGVNDATYKVTLNRGGKQIWVCPVYKMWQGALRRSGQRWQTKYPTYEGVFTCKEWVHFSNFKLWVDSHELDSLKGLQLDKDILVDGSRSYSPETCAIIPQWMNKLLINCSKDSSLPLGVYYKNKGKNSVSELRKPYYVQINNGDGHNQKWVGAFETSEEAHKSWQLEKAQQIKNAVIKFRSEKSYRKDVEDALISKADYLTNSAKLNLVINNLQGE